MDSEKLREALSKALGKEVTGMLMTIQTEDNMMDITYGTTPNLAVMCLSMINTMQDLLRNTLAGADTTTLQ